MASQTAEAVIDLIEGSRKKAGGDGLSKQELDDLTCKSLMINGLCQWLNNIPNASEKPESLHLKIDQLDQAEELFEHGLSILKDSGVSESIVDYSQFKDRLKQVKATKKQAIELYTMSIYRRTDDSQSIRQSSVSNASSDKSKFRIRSVIQGKKSNPVKLETFSPSKKHFYKRKPMPNPSQSGKGSTTGKSRYSPDHPSRQEFGQSGRTKYIKTGFQQKSGSKKRASSQQAEAQSEKLEYEHSQEEDGNQASKKATSIRRHGEAADFDSEIDPRSSPQTDKSLRRASDVGLDDSSGMREVNIDQGVEEEVVSSDRDDGDEENSERYEDYSGSRKREVHEEKEIEKKLKEKLKKIGKKKHELENSINTGYQKEIIELLKTLIATKDSSQDQQDKSTIAQQYLPRRLPHVPSPFFDQHHYQSYVNQSAETSKSLMQGYYPPSVMMHGIPTPMTPKNQISMSMIQPPNLDNSYRMANMNPSNLLQVPGRGSVSYQNRSIISINPRSTARSKIGEVELDHTEEGIQTMEVVNHSHIIQNNSYRPEMYDMSRDMRADYSMLKSQVGASQVKPQSQVSTHEMQPGGQSLVGSASMIPWNKNEAGEDLSLMDASRCQELEGTSDPDLEQYVVPETHQMTLRNYRRKTEASRNMMGRSIYLCDFDLDMDRIIMDFKKLIKNNAHSFSKNVIIDNLFYVIKLQIVCQKNQFEAIMCPMLSNTNDQDPRLCDDISFKREHLQKEQFIEMLNQVTSSNSDCCDGQDISDRFDLHDRHI